MKTVRTLRLLSLLGFLLLMAPFYKQCEGGVLADVEISIDTTAVHTSTVKNNNPIVLNNNVKDSIVTVKRKEIPFYQKAYEFFDNDNNENAIELAFASREYFNITFQELKELSNDLKKHKYDSLYFIIRTYSFVFIVLISFSIFILSLFKRVKWINKLSISNLIFLLITIICILLFDPFLETYKQFKWGYYAFTLVQIGIYYSSKLQISEA